MKNKAYIIDNTTTTISKKTTANKYVVQKTHLKGSPPAEMSKEIAAFLLPCSSSFPLSLFHFCFSSYPLFCGSQCYPLGQAITSLLLFIPSAAWPPNHLHGCPFHLVGIHGKRGGSPSHFKRNAMKKIIIKRKTKLHSLRVFTLTRVYKYDPLRQSLRV